MKVSDYYGSRYLSAEDLDGKQVSGAIVEIGVMEFEKDGKKQRPKIIVVLEGAEKPLVLNATNAGRISDIAGEETDNWLGWKVDLAVGKVIFQGKTVPGLVVSRVYK